MSYLNLKTFLRDKINNAASTKDAGRYRQHQTVLNNLVTKYKIIDELHVPVGLTDDLEDTLSRYQSALMQDGKPDTRTQKSKARRLSELYINEVQVFNREMSFGEVIDNALKQKYGDELWTGVITPSNQASIKKEHVTYNSIAADIVLASRGVINNPFPKIKWNEYDEIQAKAPGKKVNLKLVYGAGVKIAALKELLSGNKHPTATTRTPIISFMEIFFDLPKNTLVDKMIDRAKTSRSASKKKELNSRRKNLEHQVKSAVRKNFKFTEGLILNDNLRNFYNQYSNFKINAVQPDLSKSAQKNYDDSEIRLKVYERKSWTPSNNGKVEIQVNFLYALKFFQAYCVRILNIPFSDVSTFHLTTPEIIEGMTQWSKKNNYGAGSVRFILSLLGRCCNQRGFLRLTMENDDGDIKKFNNNCNHILNEYKENLDILDKRIVEPQGAKTNVKFLLNAPVDERRSLINKADRLLMEESEQALKDTLKLSENFVLGKYVAPKDMRICCELILSAYHKSMVAMINEISFVSALRVGNLIGLCYFPNESSDVKNQGYPILSYHKKINRYELNIPLTGPSLDSESSEVVKYFKNSYVSDTTPVNVILPEYLSSIISKFLKARKRYLEVYIPFFAPIRIEETVSKIEYINGFDDLPEKEIILDNYEKDIVFYQNFNPDDCKLLFPHLTNPNIGFKLEYLTRSIKTEPTEWLRNQRMRRNLLMLPGTMARHYKDQTYHAYKVIDPEINQSGVNIHATRHIAVTTHLHYNKGDFYGAAAILNDKIEQVIKTYGDKDRETRMQELGNIEHPALAI